MALTFTEDFDGQLSLFGTEDNSLIISSNYNILIDNISREVKKLYVAVSKFRIMENKDSRDYVAEEDLKNVLKENCDRFINRLIEYYQKISLEEIIDHYEEDATEWHKLNKVLLFYLKNFVYPNGLVKTLNDYQAGVLENIIALDQIHFKEEYYNDILKEIQKRKKVRVENYIIYDAKNFLNEINSLVENKGEAVANIMRGPKLIDFLKQKNILEDLFISKVDLDDKTQRGILAMLFLHFLRECVYNDPRNAKINKFIDNIEFFVIINYSPDFVLSERQKVAYEIALNNVSKRMVNYVNEHSSELFKAIKDYDLIEERKRNKKHVMFEQTEDVTDLPDSHSAYEIKKMLETYLNSVFLLKLELPKANIPIYCENALSARNISMKLALIYLGRFVYQNPNNSNNPAICLLEDYIHDDPDFYLDSQDMGEMFSTKSKLLSRVAMRRARLEYRK